MVKKGRRVTDEQIGDMLRLKREGKTDIAIAKTLGIHRQTVGRYLKRRRNDILADEARKQVLIDELRNHFQELVSFAEVPLKWHLDASSSETGYPTELRARLPGPISVSGKLGLPATGSSSHMDYEWRRMYFPMPRDSQLTQALRQHTKDSDLWTHWDAWRNEVGQYERASRALFQWVYDKVESQRWQGIDPESVDSVRKYLFGNILRKVSGLDYEEIQVKGRELTTPEARRPIARSPDSEALRNWLIDLLAQTENLPEWDTLHTATENLMQRQPELMSIVREIDSALEGITLMHAFPGRCHLCPV